MVITAYTCGHEEVDQSERASPICLYGVDTNRCRAELGRAHTVKVQMHDYCPKCLRVFESFKRANRPNEFAPRLTAIEAEKQANNRLMLAQYARPAPQPVASRLAQINGLTKATLTNYLASNPDIYNAANFMWFVMFIAALPRWLDRTALVLEMEPWFATLFDEEAQTCVRPSLRAMNCEHTLHDVMVWKLDGPAISVT
ncbi:hypothetical protein Hte_012444 [Hypoxylon texense]